MYAKQDGDMVYAIGMTYDELGGSHYYDLRGAVGNNAPLVHAAKARVVFDALSKATAKGLVQAMHDCSEGGIGVCAAEMAFSGGLGMDIFLSEVPYKNKYSSEAPRNDFILFSESNSRFLVEVNKDDKKEFEKILKAHAVPFGIVGCFNRSGEFKVWGLKEKLCLKAGLRELKEAWQKPLRW